MSFRILQIRNRQENRQHLQHGQTETSKSDNSRQANQRNNRHYQERQRSRSKQECEGEYAQSGLTLEMSGGHRHAQRACGRPLD
jgi:hypothetical protein